VLESFVTKRRDRKAALAFFKKAMKRYGQPKVIVTDRLKSYRAAMKVVGNQAAQEVGRWKNNRAGNSHVPFRRRERAMSRFKLKRSLQEFSSIHSAIFNHFNVQTHLVSRSEFKIQREASLIEWQQHCAA
jgi:putative transposase